MSFKGILSLIVISVLAAMCFLPVAYSKDSPPPQNQEQTELGSIPIYYNRGTDRELCQEIHKLFSLPENKDYLYSQEQLKAMSVEEKQREWRTARPLFIPTTDEFKNFAEPIWEGMSDEDAHRQLSEFINFLQERPEIGAVPVELGKDYKIQQAQIDMNLDRSPETVYRSVSIDGGSLEVKESATNFISIHSQKNGVLLFPGLHLKGQIVLYKGEPVFLNRERGLAALSVQPSLENQDIVNPQRKFEPLGCAFSSTDNRNLGD